MVLKQFGSTKTYGRKVRENRMKIESSSGAYYVIKNSPQVFDLSKRVKRSLKAFAVGFALALGSLPLPGLHFFLVPAFLIYAIYSGVSRYKEENYIDLTEAKCPHCGKSIYDKGKYFKNLPIRIHCYECRSQLRIVKLNQ